MAPRSGSRDDAETLLRELAARFAREELAPEALARDRYPFAAFDRKHVDLAGQLGLLVPTLPADLGGAEVDRRGLSTVLAELARADAAFAALVLCQVLTSELVRSGGGPAPRPSLGCAPAGADELSAYPLYADPEEPPAGVRALQRAGGTRLEGELDGVALLPVARAVVVPARLEDAAALFLLETDVPGLRIGEPVVSLGLRACPMADLELDCVRVDAAQRIGGADGLASWRALTDRHRPAVAAIALGVLTASRDAALSYAKERRQGRKPILEHDMVRRMLAEMTASIELGEAALAGLLAGDEAEQRARPLAVQELVTRAASLAGGDGVQVFGGYGYMKEYGQEKRMRDAKQLQAVFGRSPVRLLRVLDAQLAGSATAVDWEDPSC